MKKILAAFAVIVALAGAVRADIDAGELTSIALKDAVNDAKASLAASVSAAFLLLPCPLPISLPSSSTTREPMISERK